MPYKDRTGDGARARDARYRASEKGLARNRRYKINHSDRVEVQETRRRAQRRLAEHGCI